MTARGTLSLRNSNSETEGQAPVVLTRTRVAAGAVLFAGESGYPTLFLGASRRRFQGGAP